MARKGGLTETEAKDVVQETMFSVAKHMPTFKYDPAIGSFKAWLFNMTRWRMTDVLRKRKPIICPPVSSEGPSWHDSSQNCMCPEDADRAHTDPFEKLWNEEWEKHIFHSAISKIKRRVDPKKYQIFDCYANRRWSVKTVSSTFKVSANQVYVIKHRVTELIKAEVKRLEAEML
jgi:RNA polymerase sigma-70 factor (ECF subfamily)